MSRMPSHIILTPAMQKRLSKERKKPPKSNQEQIDLQSIRERRERLEAMIQSHRLPPLAPPATTNSSSTNSSNSNSGSGSQRSSRMSLSPHWKEKDPLQPRPERQPTPQPKRSSVRLTPMPSRGSHHDPLPEIKQQKEQDEDNDGSRPLTEDYLQEIHQQMTLEMQQLMQHQMQKMHQLLQQKKEQQLRKKERQEQLEQQLMQQRAQEAQAKESQKRASQEMEHTATTAGDGDHQNQAPDGGADDTHKADATDLEEDNRGEYGRDKVEEEGEGEDEEEEDISGELVEIMEGIRCGSDSGRQLQYAKRVRELLSSSSSRRPPINQLLRAGLLPALVPCMTKDDRPELQLEAAWAVTNIASGKTQHARAVVDAGAVVELVRLLSSPSVSVKEQAVWALGNVVGDGVECRDAAVRAGVVGPLTSLLQFNMPLSLRRQVCWVITNLFWIKEPKMSPEERRQCAFALKELVGSLDTQVQADALWGTAHFADMGPAAVDDLVKVGLVKDMVQRLYSDQERVITSALRATGSVAAGTHEQTDAVVQAGALPIYRDLLTHSNQGIAREAAWILSNITAGTVGQIQLVIDVQVVPALIAAVEKEDAELRKEATWALANMTSGCTTQQVALLANSGVVSSLCGLLAGHDPGIILVSLDAISNIFKKTEDEESIVRVMEAYDGLRRLRTLETHSEAQVSKMAKYLTTTYFSGHVG